MHPEHKRTLSHVLSSERLSVLTTKSSSYPYPSLVSFASSEDFATLFFATRRNTRKYENIQRDPRVSMLATTAMNAPEDLRNAVAVTALGEAFEAEAESLSAARSILLAKMPLLAKFARDPSSAIMQVAVRKYIIVSEFEKVQEVEMSPEG